MNRKRHRESASPTDSMVFNDDRYNDADDDQPMNESKPIGDSNDCTEAETCLQETNIEPHMVIFDVAEDCSNGMDTTMEEEATTPSNTAIVEDTITTANKTSKDDTEKEATICVDETMDEEEATTPANSTMDEDETITLASTLMEVEATTPVNNTTAKESSTPSKKTNKGDGVDEDIRAFFTSPVVSSSDVALVGPSVTRSLEEVVVLMETKGPKLYTEYKANKTKNQYRSASKKKGENDDGTKNDKPTEEDYDPSCLEGTDPRSYQMALLNIAKKQNTIVHLGTGTGKTLIALLLIKEYSAAFEQGKQTVFLVPSVALAVQQYTTIKVNLPFTVGKAYSGTAQSEESKKKLAACNILVATHGACLDLLAHRGDLFQVSNWNLLVVDECHNCTGNSSYVNLLNNYYHKTKPEDQPRVLGLTASPLINVKKNHSDQQLDDELARLEKIMDARIVSLDDIGLEEGDEHKGLWLKEADEKLVRYEPTPPPLVGTLPDADNKTLFQLHSRRRKEFRNFTTLYNDVGAFPLGLYARHLLEDLSRNTYENESANQFLSAQQYIRSLVSFSEQECIAAPELGLSSKLLVLEALLQREIEGNSTGANKAVCVVFVQRRITALALKVYFSRRLESKTNGSEWPPFHQPALKGQDNHRGDEALRFNKNEATCAGRENYQYTEAKACPSKTEMADAVRTIHEGDGAFYQFEDADPDDDPYFFEVPYTILTHSVEDPQSFFSVAGSQQNRSHHTYSLDRKELIRCDVLVRKPNQLFKSLNSGVTLSPEQEGEVGLFSVHRERDIRRVINGLRSREINVLIATSIVEEGVDVQACSFVAVFDDLQTIKSYIQMKGRARMEGAKFFVLQTRCPDEKSYLSLEDAKAIDLRVRRYICSRRSYQRAIATTGTKIQVEDYIEPDLTSLERSAVKSRLYRAKHGDVTDRTAKSLLYRFALRQPMDNVVRSSKEALRAHLPFYDDNVLRLPSFFGASLRTIHLPTYCQDKTKKERQAILALIACVRLHHYGLLTDRLLPLSRNDIRDRIYAASVKNHLLSPIQRAEPLAIRKEFDGTATVFQYNVILEGSAIEQARKSLNVGERQIALVTLRPLGGLPVYNHKHPEFGLVSCRLGTVRTSKFTGDAVATLSDFFAVLMNARWKRRTKDSCFQSAASDGQSLTSNFYCVGCVRQSGEMDWEFMKMILRESRRDADERLSVVQSLSETEMLPVPRLWSPIYREHSVYVTYGPADLRCDSDFPADTKHTNIKTYQDYFMNVWKLPVPEDAPLFRCQRLWKLPSTYFPIAANDTGTQNMNTHENNSDGFPHLGFVLLPKCLCAETSLISNAWLSFELIVLPQFLYHFERHLTGKAFTDFCVERFPALGRSLTSAQPEDVVGLLSAKSCSDQCSYERLEWLGDAVLKLVQTDAIMKSKSLRDWVANLHEGDLDSIRSVMCSNAYLHSMCKSTGCDQFIRTERLERGIWTPTSLELYSQSAGTITSDSQPANKVCADVIEAILGFVYLDGGYSLARKVADELQITLSWSNDSQENGRYEQDYSYLDNCLAAKAKSFTGYGSFRNPWLLEEAFTHPTALNTRTSSYQRLEWIGDAVLSVAVRHWIFDSYPKAEVGEMVLMEAPLVTNETLAFLSLRSDLHSHLQHRDRTLPGRILFYHSAVRELGKGLWSTSEFPKPMADIVESLLGAIYVDAGFEAGQKATLRVLSPILALYKESGSPSISHLKRSLLEFGGDLFTLTVLTESEFFQSHGSFDVWHGSRLGPVDRDGEDQVALVCCLGFNLLAVVDISASSAINRASALTLGVLDGSPALTQRFIAARSQTMSGIKRKATV